MFPPAKNDRKVKNREQLHLYKYGANLCGLIFKTFMELSQKFQAISIDNDIVTLMDIINMPYLPPWLAAA